VAVEHAEVAELVGALGTVARLHHQFLRSLLLRAVELTDC